MCKTHSGSRDKNSDKTSKNQKKENNRNTESKRKAVVQAHPVRII